MSATLQQLRSQAQQWLGPVASARAAQELEFDPRFESVSLEVAKLDSPTGGTVDWRAVIETGTDVLQGLSKDLRIAAYVAHALYATQGTKGLAVGVTLLAELADEFWDELTPPAKRMRRRANALAWLLDRVAPVLAELTAGPGDRDDVRALRDAGRRLAEVVGQRFGTDAPALRPFLDSIEQLHRSLPEPAPEPAPETEREPAATPATAAATATAPNRVPAPPPVAELGVDASLGDYLFEAGAALMRAAARARAANLADPQPYRVTRTGAWLHFFALPASDARGKTSLPPPPAALEQRLDAMAQHAKWPELIEEAESSVAQHRLWLDLHRYSDQALSSLGPAYRAARDALRGSVSALLRRFPGLPELRFNDDAPLAGHATRSWLDAELLGAAPGPAVPHASLATGADTSDADEALAAARALLGQGSAQQAIALLQRRVATAPTGRQRFAARLDLAAACASEGELSLARALFQAMERELVDKKLEEWEPLLATRCLTAYLDCERALRRAGQSSGEAEQRLYDRVCVLAPADALRLGSRHGTQ